MPRRKLILAYKKSKELSSENSDFGLEKVGQFMKRKHNRRQCKQLSWNKHLLPGRKCAQV
jgi:hypothetical protein